MNSLPDLVLAAPVLRGSRAQHATAVSFDVDLRGGAPVAETAEQARSAARSAGYADGWAQGQRAAGAALRAAAEQAAAALEAAETARAAALRRAVTAVGRAAAGLDAREGVALAELEDAILGAAVTVAQALLGYELPDAPDRGLAAARRAMALLPDAGPVTVRLHPEDHAALVADGGSAHDFEGRSITLRSDARLSPGDAVAECGATTVDATLGAALARVREALVR